MTRTRLDANGVDLCVETFGDSADAAILLISGGASSMDWWEDDFCELLAAGPRFVVRYDLRDTGQSVSYPPGDPGYTGADLVGDAIALLDELGIQRAHLVGVSMGGGIAQQAARAYPERIASLTLIATSSAVSGGPDATGLPPPELAARFADPPPPPDWSDRAAVIDYFLDDLRAYEGSIPSDEGELRGTRLEGRRPDGEHGVEHDQPLRARRRGSPSRDGSATSRRRRSCSTGPRTRSSRSPTGKRSRPRSRTPGC